MSEHEADARPADPEQALERLLEGNARFAADRKLNHGHDTVRRTELAAGQEPFAVVLGCADSRVPPEVIFDQRLGDLFVVRVAGNTAAEATVIGSVEYALAELGAMLVLVLGHEACGAVAGAVAAATEGTELPGSIGKAVAPIVPVVEGVAAERPGLPAGELQPLAVRANVAASAAALSERSEIVAGLIETGRARVVGAEYRLASGEVTLL